MHRASALGRRPIGRVSGNACESGREADLLQHLDLRFRTSSDIRAISDRRSEAFTMVITRLLEKCVAHGIDVGKSLGLYRQCSGEKTARDVASGGLRSIADTAICTEPVMGIQP